MNLDAQRADLELSHRILNYLQATAHGEVFFLEALKELGSPEISDEAVGQARTTLKAALELYQAMGEGAYAFSASWTSPETFDAQRAVRMLDDLVQRSRTLISRCRSMPSNFEGMTREHRRFAFGVVRRGLVAENFFKQGLFDQARLMNLPNLADFEAVAKASMQILEGFDREYYAAMYRKELSAQQEQVMGRVWGRQRLMLNIQLVDLVELASIYRGGEEYLEKELAISAPQEWSQRRFPPADAARWSGFDFSPDLASQWRAAGVTSPLLAYDWGSYGFTAEEAAAWLPLQQAPDSCAAWREANYGPDLALSFVKRGFQKPSDVDPSAR